jgi:steroid 5-alpha reductase family enzyme
VTLWEGLGFAAASWAWMACAMAVVWAIQRRTGNAGIVDVAWTAGVGAIAIALALIIEGPPWRRALLAALAGLWSLRLAAHLWRRVAGNPEDRRYTALRRAWGPRAQRNLFLFYQAQAAACALFALPFIAVLARGTPSFRLVDAAGIMIWAVAMAGEWISDAQLERWRRNHDGRGGICERGLWAFSRHPNYFFEWLHWWAYVLLATGSPLFWLAFAGPLAMGHFLLNVTGLPATERQMLATRGAAYRDYQRRVSPFVPWRRRAGRGDAPR